VSLCQSTFKDYFKILDYKEGVCCPAEQQFRSSGATDSMRELAAYKSDPEVLPQHYINVYASGQHKAMPL